MSSGQAGYYLGLAREDYYLSGGEPPGRWFGEGAERLGLSGEVEADQLYNLFAGRSPRGERSLIQNQSHEGKAEHRPGWDLTFSAPKSVSALWSQADEGKRIALQNIHAKAVSEALGYLQNTAVFTRRGKGGAELERVGLVCAMFEHSTSRALDPQLHTHALVMNLSLRDDHTSGTLSSLDLFLSKMTAGALYRTELAKGLQKELGLAVHRERSWFEVDGVLDDLVKCFSKRREAIEEALRKTGLSSAEAAAMAAIQTRDAKNGVSREELFKGWREEGAHLGWSTEQSRTLFDAFVPRFDVAAETRMACRVAAERLTWAEAYFSESDFVRYLAEEAQGRGIGVKEVLEGAQTFLAKSSEIVRLGVHRGEERFSTETMVALEKELLKTAKVLEVEERHKLSPETTMAVLTKHSELSEEQMKAVWHITAGTGGVAIVSGMAGTGKTRMLEAAREAWEKEGFQVEGAALAARAAKELSKGAGTEATTIAKTLLDIVQGKKTLTNRTVLVVDEAGMVATPDMAKLFAVCETAGAKIVLIGDERQLQPIGPGAPFMELGERLGRAELSDVRRQNEEWARQAVKDMADGNSSDALKAFADRGFVTVSESRAESMQAAISAWRESGTRPEDTLILAGTKKEVGTLNRLAQAARREAGELGESRASFAGQAVFENDRVMFTDNRRTLGVTNGSRGTVCAIAGDGSRVSVRLDSGEKVTVQPHAFPHVQLGYAATTHKAQGATTQMAFVLGGGAMQGRELSYVQASRARVETHIFATKAETGDDIARLAQEMARSRAKEMVLTLERLNDRPVTRGR